MINGKTVIGIIPARGKSKQLPKKNKLNLAGKPLLVWSIEAGQNCKYLDKLIVSSDDKEILEISKKAGADTMIRPNELASDEASTFSVIEHVFSSIENHYDYTLLLQPTSPLRSFYHIDEAFDFLFQKKADAVISVCEMDHSPLWANTLPTSDSMKNFLKDEVKGLRRQDLPTFFRINGAVYICKTERLLKEKTFFIRDNIFAYKMNHNVSIDIDGIEDFELAEFIAKRKKNSF